MRRFLIFTGIGIALILIIMAGTMFFMKKYTKSFSPEDQLVYTQGDLKITVLYNRPFKKDREIFGALVPFGEVWRTGANESTTFETNQALMFEGKTLEAGSYSLWTIPTTDSWTIIFNTEHGQWGINSKGEANRDPNRDAVTIDVPIMKQEQVFEQFTIDFHKVGEDAEMVLLWNNTVVPVPFTF